MPPDIAQKTMYFNGYSYFNLTLLPLDITLFGLNKNNPFIIKNIKKKKRKIKRKRKRKKDFFTNKSRAINTTT